MNPISYRTQAANKRTVTKEWVVIDAADQILGRLASKAAAMIRGKHKPNFTPHVDCGDWVIIINADKISFTGKKWEEKEYISHTGYPGGQRFATPKELSKKSSGRIIEHAIKGMLPKNRLGRKIFGNLFIYPGDNHPHEAQQPKKVTVTH